MPYRIALFMTVGVLTALLRDIKSAAINPNKEAWMLWVKQGFDWVGNRFSRAATLKWCRPPKSGLVTISRVNPCDFDIVQGACIPGFCIFDTNDFNTPCNSCTKERGVAGSR